jgi:hypothetical protein
MSASPSLVSGALRNGLSPCTTPAEHLEILTAAAAALHTLSLKWTLDPQAGQEGLERLRQAATCPDTPRQAAVHDVAMRALSQAAELQSLSWDLGVVNRALEELQKQTSITREQYLNEVPTDPVESMGLQVELLELLSMQRRLETVMQRVDGPQPGYEDQAWINQCGPQGALRRLGREWLAQEAGSEGRRALWERLCDVLFAHEKREFFSDVAEQRQQQYAGFGRRLVALWESHRALGDGRASDFMGTEEFAELIAGTCHTGWESRTAQLEHMLQLARQAHGLSFEVKRCPTISLFLTGAEVAAQWRQAILRDHVLHRVTQAFSLQDVQTGSVDAHVLPSLQQTCNDALALGLGPWEREEIWVEEFRELLLEEGEPNHEFSRWFWEGPGDGDVQKGLFEALEGTFELASPEVQYDLFDFLLDWYGSERSNREALEIPSVGLTALRDCTQRLEEAIEKGSPAGMIRSLRQLALHAGQPFFEHPSQKAWKQLMRAAEGESHAILAARLRVMRFHNPDWDPRRLVEELAAIGQSTEPHASLIRESLSTPAIAEALATWQRSCDPEVWEEFLEKEIPAASESALRSLPDLMVREQTETLRELLIAGNHQVDGTETLKITPFGLKVWAVMLGLTLFEPDEHAPAFALSLTRWINQAADRPDHPQTRLTQQQEEYVIGFVRQDGLRLGELPKKFRSHTEVVLAAVQQNGMALAFAEGEALRHRGIAVSAVTQTPEALREVSQWLRSDRHIARIAVQQNGLLLQLVRYPARGDRTVALDAVRQNGLALEHAPDSLRADPEVIEAAIEQNPAAQAFALPKRGSGSTSH